MAWNSNDRILWLGLAIAGITISYSAYRAVEAFDQASETTVPIRNQCTVSQETENEIDADSLATLSKHPSLHIREAAIKILVTRVVHSNLHASIHADAQSSDEKLSSRAKAAIKLVEKFSHGFAEPPRRRTRPTVPVADVVAAADQVTVGSNDTWLVDGPDGSHTAVGDDDNGESGWAGRYVGDGTLDVDLEDAARPRQRSGSPEEQARRRRRREAIVLHEGDRPLTQEDIIQRRRTENE
ncbi:hypothetical protein BT63DRAFT_419556 [Microthyrium microscopicum]|uniref:Uncharacterized protein n=1 Tax=Microthyrium microscopicum TaxID=703497 RepID=A0A6A6UPP2_9PEZI|nr:hypothetical protein BT63DRAFT_419556 [Microthyrium microscopicum]